MQRILIVEDEQPIRKLLEYNLKLSGYETISAADGEAAIELALSEQPDLIVLDIMLPKLDGIEVCKMLRSGGSNIPIIMLTAKGDEFDKVHGLEIGADDYMTKPFSPREVVARIKAVLRRSKTKVEHPEVEETLLSGPFKVYLERYEVYLHGEKLDFTPKEFELLAYLIQNKNRVLSRDLLLSAVWNYDFAGDTRIVDVHVSHLREKVEKDTRNPQFIKTVRGIGYKFEELDL
ncbi:response regulator transcription factor [Sporosarcina jiandibaonis]|uniref:response regulator transcription factor n=1 Tax=Sporosarcina jiandibaonis TaxID=2715535 RepID=UPI001551E232|nr:response regulator transcription factor [Sporosarcina jiandibaonis]